MEQDPINTSAGDRRAHAVAPVESGAKSFLSENFSGIAVLVAGAMIAGAVLYKDGGVLPERQGAPQEAKGVAAVVEVGNLPALGSAQAKVTIVEFGDYQCPFCQRFFQTVEARIRDEYVKSGKARFVWRDFAFLGEESVWAAEAARCAHDQGRFWEYHDLLFLRQSGENRGSYDIQNLKQYARDLELNVSEFDACLDSHRHRAAVEADTAKGREYGVNGTPTSFINGKMIVGAVSYEQFKEAIDSFLQ